MTQPPIDPAGEPTGSREPDLPAWARRPQSSSELGDEELARFIGPRWDSTYRRKLAPFRADPSFVPTWNWSAALFGPVWLVYRKLYLALGVFVLVSILVPPLFIPTDTALTLDVLKRPENRWLANAYLGLNLSMCLAVGGTANWLLFRRARAARRLVAAQALPSEAGDELLRRIGGVNRAGATMLVVLFGVLQIAQGWLGAAG